MATLKTAFGVESQTPQRDDEERRSLIRNPFEYVSIDFDKQEIVDFRLKPWADRFIALRARLYEEGYDDLTEEEKKNASSI